MMRPIFTEAPYIQLVMEATQMMENWGDWVGGDAGFAEPGFLRFTQGFGEAELGGDLDLMKQLGVEFEVVDASVLRSRVPDAAFRHDKRGLWLRRQGTRVCIPPKRSRRQPAAFHHGYYHRRHNVENLFCRIKRFRRIATRYDKLAIVYLSFVQLVVVVDWLSHRFENTP